MPELFALARVWPDRWEQLDGVPVHDNPVQSLFQTSEIATVLFILHDEHDAGPAIRQLGVMDGLSQAPYDFASIGSLLNFHSVGLGDAIHLGSIVHEIFVASIRSSAPFVRANGLVCGLAFQGKAYRNGENGQHFAHHVVLPCLDRTLLLEMRPPPCRDGTFLIESVSKGRHETGKPLTPYNWATIFSTSLHSTTGVRRRFSIRPVETVLPKT